MSFARSQFDDMKKAGYFSTADVIRHVGIERGELNGSNDLTKMYRALTNAGVEFIILKSGKKNRYMWRIDSVDRKRNDRGISELVAELNERYSKLETTREERIKAMNDYGTEKAAEVVIIENVCMQMTKLKERFDELELKYISLASLSPNATKGCRQHMENAEIALSTAIAARGEVWNLIRALGGDPKDFKDE